MNQNLMGELSLVHTRVATAPAFNFNPLLPLRVNKTVDWALVGTVRVKLKISIRIISLVDQPKIDLIS